jgi:hypothetical protein
MSVVTRKIATKVRDLVDAGLVAGVGVPEPGKMCVEAAVCFALGLPHGDDPKCVAQPLRRLKMRLNDSAWSSNQARAKGLRRLAVAQLGSIGALDENAFVGRLCEMTIRKALPIGLRAVAKLNRKHAKAMEAAAVRCEHEGTREAAQNSERVARAAAAAAAYAADYASRAADYAAAYAAAPAYAADYAASAAAYAATAASAAAADYSSAAAAAAARDRVLAQYAEWVIEILIELQAPGCDYLDLVPLGAA